MQNFDVIFDLHPNKRELFRVKNGEAGDLRRHHIHYDVTVMIGKELFWCAD